MEMVNTLCCQRKIHMDIVPRGSLKKEDPLQQLARPAIDKGYIRVRIRQTVLAGLYIVLLNFLFREFERRN